MFIRCNKNGWKTRRERSKHEGNKQFCYAGGAEVGGEGAAGLFRLLKISRAQLSITSIVRSKRVVCVCVCIYMEV